MRTALDESKALLVRRWGELGGYWGINRTMAEIYALLFVSPGPLCTDEVMEELKISRGNASMNLRGLLDWALIQRVHKLGDRKEYFQAETNVWRMFETIMRERRRREVEPIVATIDRCLEMVAGRKGAAPPVSTSAGVNAGADAGQNAGQNIDPRQVRAYCQRLRELRTFLATMSALFELVLKFGGDGLQQLTGLLTVAGDPAKPLNGQDDIREPQPLRKARKMQSRRSRA